MISKHTHTTKRPYGFNKHQESACCSLHSLPSVFKPCFNLPYLLHVSCYINAHLMKGNAPTVNPVMLHTKKSRPALLWQRRGAKKLRNGAQFFFPPQILNQYSKEKIEVKALNRPMCKQTGGEMSSSAAWATRFPCLRLSLLTSSVPLNARQAGSTGYTTWERSPRYSAYSHRGPLFFFLFVFFTSVAPLRWKRAPSVNAVSVWAVLSMWWRIKAGGCAAWCTPSCCCSQSVAFAELCVIQFTEATACARRLMSWGVFFDFIKCMRCHLQ